MWGVLALAGWTGVALAHAVLTRASLDKDAVQANTPTSVILTFNSRVEPALTKVVLVDTAHAERPVEVRPTAQPSEVEVTLPPLPAGSYGLRYKVLAADGHVTESMLRFRVMPVE